MTDGPHRSLKMSNGWKKFAECVYNEAYAPVDVRDRLSEALMQDWRKEVPDSLWRRTLDILCGTQGSLFGEQLIDQIKDLHGSFAGYPLSQVFLDYLIMSLDQGLRGDLALEKATYKALKDRTERRARQVKEHYFRRPTQGRAKDVYERIETGVAQSDLAIITAQILGKSDRDGPRRSVRHTGLDDGVHL